jgi:hypothetical protein
MQDFRDIKELETMKIYIERLNELNKIEYYKADKILNQTAKLYKKNYLERIENIQSRYEELSKSTNNMST